MAEPIFNQSEILTVGTVTVVGVTTAKRVPTSGDFTGIAATQAFVQCVQGEVYVSWTGESPSASVGAELGLRDGVNVVGKKNVEQLKFLAISAESKVKIQYAF